MSAAIATFCSVAACGALCAASEDAKRPSEQPLPYRLVLEAACAALPEAPREFILAHRSAIEDAACGRATRPADGALGEESQADHFVLLDIAAVDAHREARLAAVTSFPHSKKDARALSEDHGIRDDGDLPWLIEEHFGKLVEALRKSDAGGAERQMGLIVHLSTDAALPFNATTLAIDELLADVPAALAADSKTGRRLRERFHKAFVERLRERFAYEMRVSPQRVLPVASPLEAAFATLIQAHRVAQELAEIDEEAIRDLGAEDVTAFASSADIYSAALAERVAPILENQLESGALLAAGLIHTAWMTARPSFVEAPPEAPAAPAPAPSAAVSASAPASAAAPSEPAKEQPKEAQEGAATLAGSLGSTVYHRGDCSHVARIKPENRVEFKSKAEAEAAGRKPCRACKPDVENPPPNTPDKK